MTPRRALSAAVLAAALAAPAAAGDRTPPPPPDRAYLIANGDGLRVAVWKEPDLTLDVTVRPDGMITMPLLGDVAAAGRAPSALAASLVAALAELIENPRVTVTVVQAAAARVYVLGQVSRPGDFPLSGRMTVLKALALAGGFRDFARPEDLVLGREDRTVVPFNYKRVADGREAAHDVALAAGDTVVVP